VTKTVTFLAFGECWIPLELGTAKKVHGIVVAQFSDRYQKLNLAADCMRSIRRFLMGSLLALWTPMALADFVAPKATLIEKVGEPFRVLVEEGERRD
jgi:hypothetical protein